MPPGGGRGPYSHPPSPTLMARGPIVESPTRKWRLVERPKTESKLGGNAKSEQTTRGVDSESDSADELIAEQEAGGSDHNEADEDEMVEEIEQEHDEPMMPEEEGEDEDDDYDRDIFESYISGLEGNYFPAASDLEAL